MRTFVLTLCTTLAVGLLTACSSGTPSTGPSSLSGAAGSQSQFSHGHFVPQWSKLGSLVPSSLRPTGPMPLHGRTSPMGMKNNLGPGGIYAAQFYGTDVFGYPHNNMANGAPTCNVPLGTVVNVQDVGADSAGNLIVPEGFSNLGHQVQVYAGPGLCGSELGFVVDAWGQPDDASSWNAATGNIAVANMYDAGGAGSISVCTLSGGCASNLTNANMYEVAGVVMNKGGDCWASAVTQTGTATLTYFKGCTGAGVAATGFVNTYYGGLDIDNNNNIAAISAFDAKLYVYRGCNPTCTLVGGPFALQGQSMFGKFNKQSMVYVAADFQYGQIDVYHYSLSSLSYWYSFNNGLTASDYVEGVAESPRSRR